MTKPVFSLQRLAESKKTMRAAAAVALWSVTAPVYSGGLTNLVKGVADHTILYVYTERSDTGISPVQEGNRGVAAIVYSPTDHQRGLASESAFRVSQVASALGGQYTVTDLVPVRDYALHAADDDEDGKKGISSGAIIGGTMLLVGFGLTAWLTNDDGNRPRP